MRWAVLALDVVMTLSGTVMLLYAYRIVGKRPGADKEYDAAVARQSPNTKVVGWCIIGMAVLGFISYFTDSLW